MKFFKQQKVNSINTITLEIEEAFNNNFSIVVYDNEGGLFVEKIAKTIEKAKEIGEKLFKNAIEKY